MATKRILRLTGQEALVKVDGTVGSVTIDLATDLLLPTEVIDGAPLVNIITLYVTGTPGAVANISRGGTSLWDMQAGPFTELDMLNLGGTSDATLNSANLTVTTYGADLRQAGVECQVLVKLRKVAGYKSTLPQGGSPHALNTRFHC